MAVVAEKLAQAQRSFIVGNRVLSQIPQCFAVPRNHISARGLNAEEMLNIGQAHPIVFGAVAGFAKQLKQSVMCESERNRTDMVGVTRTAMTTQAGFASQL